MTEIQQEPAIFQLIRNTDVSIDAVRLYLQHYPSTLSLPVYQNDTILTVAVKACFVVNTPEMFENGDINAVLIHQLSILKIVVDYVDIEEVNNGQTIFHLLFPSNEHNGDEEAEAISSAINKLVSNSILDILLNHVKFSNESILFIRNNKSQLALHMAVYHDNMKAARKLLEHMGVSSSLYSNYDYMEPGRTIPLLHYILMHPPSSKLIASVFSIFPEAASIRDSDGILPIAVALENSLPYRKIEVILDKYSQAVAIPNGDGDLPLHLAAMDCPHRHDIIKLLIEYFDTALLTPNSNGQLPLHCALEYQSSCHNEEPIDLVTVKLLSNDNCSNKDIIRNESEVVWHGEELKTGSTTDTSVDSSPMSSIKTYDSGSQIIPYDENEVDKSFCSIKSESCTRSALLYKDSYGEIPLHIVCRRITACSVEIIAWFLECYPETANMKNEFGHLPMHLFAASENHDADDDIIEQCFDLLFYTNPGAIYTRDDEGDVPLHCLFTHNRISPRMLHCLTKNVKCFKESIPLMQNPLTGYLPLHTVCRNAIYEGQVLDEILTLHPEASLCYDNEGYLPFHIALQMPYNCPVAILKKLLYQSENESQNLSCRMTTLPCTANGIPALFVACENSIDYDNDTSNFEMNECRTLDVIHFLVENSPELFIRSNRPM
jgi:ankyrin repeat protein